jgi:hypothetical protein
MFPFPFRDVNESVVLQLLPNAAFKQVVKESTSTVTKNTELMGQQL